MPLEQADAMVTDWQIKGKYNVEECGEASVSLGERVEPPHACRVMGAWSTSRVHCMERARL